MAHNVTVALPSAHSKRARKFVVEFFWSRPFQTILLALLIVLFVGKTLIPAWRHYGAGDISNYYLVAKLYREGRSVERVYDWTWFQRQEDHSGIGPHLVGFIPSTPISALPLVPLSSLPILQAHRYWLLANIAILLCIATLLKRMTHLGWTTVGVLILLATNPLRNHFLVGQLHLLVLLLVTAAAALYFAKRPFWCGVLLAAAAALKIYPALFLFYFLIKKEWRAVCGLAVGSLAFAGVWIYLFGESSLLTYVREVLPWGLTGENIDPYNVGWDSISALLHRLLIAEPELNPSPVIHWPSLYAFLKALFDGTLFVAFLWVIGSSTGSGSRKKLEWAGYLFFLLLLSSEPLTYHFVALILSAVLAADYLIAHDEMTSVALVTLIYVLVCLPYNRLYYYDPDGWRSVLFFPRLFFMLIFAGLFLWILHRSSAIEFAPQLRSRNSVYVALALLLIACGFAQNLHHIHGHFQNYASRVLTVRGSVMATDPVVTSRGLLFTTLVGHPHTTIQDAYAAEEYGSTGVSNFYLGDDSYHPAATAEGDMVWVEVANRHGSRIIRFPAALFRSIDDTTVEVEDAEQPVVSPDGGFLAYIREVNGRNSLWIHQLKAAGTDRQIAGADYDVREAAFSPDHRVVFSSRRDGRFRLFVVNLATKTTEQLDAPTCSARYPSISQDGQWIAFSCEQRGYWQLHAMNLSTKVETQLTNVECNSVSPAWTLDSRSLIYATDCGRGLGMTALAKLNVPR